MWDTVGQDIGAVVCMCMYRYHVIPYAAVSVNIIRMYISHGVHQPPYLNPRIAPLSHPQPPKSPETNTFRPDSPVIT